LFRFREYLEWKQKNKKGLPRDIKDFLPDLAPTQKKTFEIYKESKILKIRFLPKFGKFDYFLFVSIPIFYKFFMLYFFLKIPLYIKYIFIFLEKCPIIFNYSFYTKLLVLFIIYFMFPFLLLIFLFILSLYTTIALRFLFIKEYDSNLVLYPFLAFVFSSVKLILFLQELTVILYSVGLV
jgi:hypothetical protein